MLLSIMVEKNQRKENMKKATFTSYLMNHEMKNQHEAVMYDIGPVYTYNEETDKNDIEVPEVFCHIDLADMLQEVRLLATKDIIKEFVKDYVTIFTGKGFDYITKAEQTELFDSLDLKASLSLEDELEEIRENVVPEEFAKAVKKALSADDLARFMEALK